MKQGEVLAAFGNTPSHLRACPKHKHESGQSLISHRLSSSRDCRQ